MSSMEQQEAGLKGILACLNKIDAVSQQGKVWNNVGGGPAEHHPKQTE